MRSVTWRAILPPLLSAVFLVAASVTTVEASTTSIHASPTTASVGQSVAFTATFTSSCPGTVTTHSFTIDGKTYSGVFTHTGLSGSETYSTSSLAAGKHAVAYNWKVGGTI